MIDFKGMHQQEKEFDDCIFAIKFCLLQWIHLRVLL